MNGWMVSWIDSWMVTGQLYGQGQAADGQCLPMT